jgi:hypothetical protein
LHARRGHLLRLEHEARGRRCVTTAGHEKRAGHSIRVPRPFCSETATMSRQSVTIRSPTMPSARWGSQIKRYVPFGNSTLKSYVWPGWVNIGPAGG